eukprot:TRINITY_DN2947_c0_g1_i2.p1 TRINITY_DN2947_c0_g1~~TRINITY_DN2947_c0_g1_i2.p1  ORF type:complete len:225 (+),score=85.80 TRINITY_DN2947_c0_g1_i2:71-745(+)
MTVLEAYVNVDAASVWLLCAAVAHLFFNPLFWNVTARLEYRTRFLTRLCGGHNRVACLALAAVIFSFGLTREYVFLKAVDAHPQLQLIDPAVAYAVGSVLYVIGAVLVLGATWALGIVGTYLGDYFGILMKERVTSFPFNLLSSPMYTGSTITFFATAIMKQSPVALVMAVVMFLVYQVALQFEDAFTAQIYAKSAKGKRSAIKGKGKKAASKAYKAKAKGKRN